MALLLLTCVTRILHAVENLKETSEILDPTPYFEVVFGRKEVSASDATFSQLEEKQPPKSEDFLVLEMNSEPPTICKKK